LYKGTTPSWNTIGSNIFLMSSHAMT
jgi:hypothetical protein